MEAAEALEFERAASLRDRITTLQDAIGQKLSEVATTKSQSGRRGKRGKRGGSRVPRPKKR